MLVKVKTLAGHHFEVDVKETIAQLRQAIAAQVNCSSPAELKLIHKGKVLPGDGAM